MTRRRAKSVVHRAKSRTVRRKPGHGGLPRGHKFWIKSRPLASPAPLTAFIRDL